MPVSCPAPGTPGKHNLTLTATYALGSACGGGSGMATAQASVLVQPVPVATVAPVASSVPVCSGSNRVTVEFSYTTSAPGGLDEPLQLVPRVSASGGSTACTIIQKGGHASDEWCVRHAAAVAAAELLTHCTTASASAGTQFAGKLVATCTGAFSPQAGAVAITATLTATTLNGCGKASSAAATITPACCTDAATYAHGAASQCFEHVDPSNQFCRRKPLVSRWGFYQQGELVSGDVQAGVGDRCATGGPVLGSVSARCRASDKALVFTMTSSRGSSATIRYWVGCGRPAAVAAHQAVAAGLSRHAPPRAAAMSADVVGGISLTAGRRLMAASSAATCNLWRQLPAAGPSNAIELNSSSNGATITTSWVWKPSPTAGGCTCADVFWAISAAGTFLNPGATYC